MKPVIRRACAHNHTHPPKRLAHPRSPMPPLSTLTAHATHARPLHPATLASVPYGILLVQFRVRVRFRTLALNLPGSINGFSRPGEFGSAGGLLIRRPAAPTPAAARCASSSRKSPKASVALRPSRLTPFQNSVRAARAPPFKSSLIGPPSKPPSEVPERCIFLRTLAGRVKNEDGAVGGAQVSRATVGGVGVEKEY